MRELIAPIYAAADRYLYWLNMPTISKTDVAEIIIIAFILYHILLWFKNTRAWMLFRGILVILIFLAIAGIFQMNTILWLASRLFSVAVIALVVIFQPELRSALEQLGTPDDVYERPATPFAARFIGLSNIFDSVVEGKDSSGNLILSYAGGTIKAQGEAAVGDILTLSVRTERVLYGQEDRFGFSLQGVVKSHHYTGGLLRTVLQLGNGEELTVSGMGGGDVFPPVPAYPFSGIQPAL